MKVLGCKVDDEFYHKFSELSGNINQNLRKAAELYIKSLESSEVNTVNSLNQCKNFDCKYQTLCVIIERHLEGC